MWSNTKSKAKTNKVLRTAAKVIDINQFRPFTRRTKGRQVAKVVRDDYGAPHEWFALCKEVKRRDNYCCVKCSEPENPKERLYHDVHHIRPLSKGGMTVKSNLITLCLRCHEQRHAHMRKRKV
jgi:5-methylcytosine-specific restriction endonuclease McrA